MTDPFDVLNLLWEPLPPGNPADVDARTLDRDVAMAMAALPPMTSSLWPPWPVAGRALRLDSLDQHEQLEAIFRSLAPEEHILLDQTLHTMPVDQSSAVMAAHPDSELAVLRYVVSLCDAADAAKDASSGDDFDAITAGSYLGWAAERLADVRTRIPADHHWTWILQEQVCHLSGDLAGAAEAAAQWQRLAPLDIFAWQRHIRFIAANVTLRDALAAANSATEAAPVGHDLGALVAFCAAMIHQSVAPSERQQALDSVRDDVLAAYWRSVGSIHHQPSRMGAWALNQFAGALHHLGEDELAWRELQRSRGHMTPLPWVLFDPETGPEAYDAAREYHIRRRLTGG